MDLRSQVFKDFLAAGGVHPFLGKKHTENSKRQISEKLKVLHGDGKNPVKGRVWITNEKESRMVYPSDPIPEGFRRGISTAQRELLTKNRNTSMSSESRKKIGDAVRERHRRLKMDGSTK